MTPAEFDALPDRPMPKLSRTSMRAWAARHLKTVQMNLCPLCGEFIDLRIKGEGVIDHNHKTGEIRGVLHRSCNAAEGKVTNAAARWGCKSTDVGLVVEYLKSVARYLVAPGAGVVYPMHKTEDDKRDTRNKKAREARAAAKAKSAMAIAARSKKEQA